MLNDDVKLAYITLSMVCGRFLELTPHRMTQKTIRFDRNFNLGPPERCWYKTTMKHHLFHAYSKSVRVEENSWGLENP